jgi:hypothetical protein
MKFFGLLFILLGLSSCVQVKYMPMDELNYRNKHEHISILRNHPHFKVDYLYDFEDQLGNVYDFLIFKSNISTNVNYSYATKSDIHYYLIFAYKNKHLVYWGFPEEFTRSNNDFVRRIGEKINDSILDGTIKKPSIYRSGSTYEIKESEQLEDVL